MTRQREERVERYGGLSNRDLPAQLTAGESPDLLNIDFHRGSIMKRRGYTRVNTSPFLDASVRLDGLDDYIRIPHISDYTLTNERYFAIKVMLRRQAAEMNNLQHTIACKGFGSSTDLEFELSYERTGGGTQGAWIFSWYDTVAGFSSATVNDGEIYDGPVDVARFVEWDNGELRVWDDAGTLIGSDTSAGTVAYNSTTHPIFLGVNASAADTPGSDYAAATIAEFRLGDYDAAVFTTGMVGGGKFAGSGAGEIVTREWYEAVYGTYGQLVGYWKLNDGQGRQVIDSTTNANHGEAARSGPEWVYDPDYVLGPSGLRFTGTTGLIGVTADTTDVDSLFEPETGNPGVWAISLNWRPEMDASETTVRDQTLFWMGTSTNPAPIGIRVESNSLKVYYYDGTTLHTVLSTAATLSTYVDKRLVVLVNYVNRGSTVADDEVVGIVYDTSIENPAGSPIYQGSVSLGANTPTTSRSGTWSIGNALSSFDLPFTYRTGTGFGPVFGTIDDFRIYKGTFVNSSGLTFGTAAGVIRTLFSEQTVAQPPTNTSLEVYLRMNEGEGSELNDDGAWGVYGYVYPQRGSGLYWDRGLVYPYRGVEGRGVYDLRKFSARKDGTVSRETLVITGCTVQAVDLTNGRVRVLSGGVEKGGLVSFTQYDNVVYFGARNGQRPLRLQGSELSQIGIDRPVTPPVVSTTSTVGSGFAAGTYQIYTTFYNQSSGAESNPSPAQEFTASLNDRIDDLIIPRSEDPQVTGRRVYISLIGGAVGSAAYLVADIQDNTRTTITGINITGVSSATAQLEFTANAPAPNGSLVRVWQDYLFVSGNQQFPTRLYFSQPGRVESFDTLDFLTLDSDTGDPVVALKPRQNVLAAYTQDGRWDVYPTGQDAQPMQTRSASNSVGGVGPLAVAEYGREHIVIGERNIYATNGYDDRSLSSPPRGAPGQPSPSIQKTLREGLNDSRRDRGSIVIHRAKDQVFLSLTESGETRNNVVLVYDLTRGTWSKYDYGCDVLVEIEDDNDSPWVYALTEGYLVKLDDGAYDITTTEFLTSTTNSATTFTATTNITGMNSWIGAHVYVYHTSNHTIERLRVAYVVDSGSNDIVYFYDAPVTAFAVGGAPSYLVLGGIAWFIDFMIGASVPHMEKRLEWIVFSQHPTTVLSGVNYHMAPNQFGEDPDWTTKHSLQRDSSEGSKARIPGAFSATTWRLRITGTCLADAVVPIENQPVDPFPTFTGEPEIIEFASQFKVTDVR